MGRLIEEDQIPAQFAHASIQQSRAFEWAEQGRLKGKHGLSEQSTEKAIELMSRPHMKSKVANK